MLPIHDFYNPKLNVQDTSAIGAWRGVGPLYAAILDARLAAARRAERKTMLPENRNEPELSKRGFPLKDCPRRRRKRSVPRGEIQHREADFDE